MTLDELRAQRQSLTTQIDAILDPAKDRELSAEERTILDKLEPQLKECNGKVADLESDARRRAEQAARKEADAKLNPRAVLGAMPEQTSRQFEAPAFLTRPQRYAPGQLRSFRGPDALDQAYYAGQFFLATLWKNKRSEKWCEQHGLTMDYEAEELSGQKTLVDSAGGFLVPDYLERAIIDLRLQYGVFRANTRVRPMAGDRLSINRAKSGLTAYFIGEGDDYTVSTKAWDQVSLTARKLGCLATYTKEIDEDGIVSMADDLAFEIAYALAAKEDTCGFLGTGASTTYGGITGLITRCTAATATVVTSIAGNTAFSTLDDADFLNMIGKLPSYAMQNAKWYIHKAGWAASMLRLERAAGGATPTDMASGRPAASYAGYPVVFVEVMNSKLTPQTSTAGICYFGDLAQAASFGDRRGIRIDLDSSLYFLSDQIAVKGSERFDIVVHNVGDTSNAGAMVMLSTNSS